MSWAVDADEVIAVLQSKLGRPIPALDAILKIVQANLTPVLQALGTELFPASCYPKAYHYAGEYLGDAQSDRLWPKIIVAASISTDEFGMGHTDMLQAMVTVAWPPQISREEFQLAFDTAAAVRGILRHPQYSGRFMDPDVPARMLWCRLLPTGFRMVPPDWQHYSGWIAQFMAQQVPGSNLWTEP